MITNNNRYRFQPIHILYAGVGLLTLGFGAWKLKEFFTDALRKDEAKDVIQEAEKEIVKTDLSYSKSEYETMADTLFSAMDGIGTDFFPIKTVILKIKTKSDWLALVKAFGRRKSTGLTSSFDGNLVQWLIDELSSTEYYNVSQYLKKKGVSI